MTEGVGPLGGGAAGVRLIAVVARNLGAAVPLAQGSDRGARPIPARRLGRMRCRMAPQMLLPRSLKESEGLGHWSRCGSSMA